ncbi:ROK family protein [Novosphingobium sp. MBES04]|uniref:ROK family protein n=1 Tax=Novosphingobium sp. MBES04 TaxID=1206458 RepID=UPI00057F33CC|nr:ROK family protein [Novosphingobium sp. MBES04]
MHRLAGIELGGTKTVVVLGQAGRIDERVEFATRDPETTLEEALEVLSGWQGTRALDALGIASFGPIRLDARATDFGCMLATPKPGWSGAEVRAPFAKELGCPVGLDTDVNGAALGEYRHGAGKGCTSLVYVTIGTGIGGGVLVEGHPVHGSLHPELGHLRLRRARGDGFAGACRFHGDCVEGLLSGPALAARLGCHPGEVPAHDPRWEVIAQDLAELLVHLLLTLAPQRIIVGGGVSHRQRHLLARAIDHVPHLLGGYLEDATPAVLAQRIVLPTLGDDAGPTGALEIAARALAQRPGHAV